MLAALTLLAAAQVCSAADFGPTNQDPLVITGTWQVGDGCFLDFGARLVEIQGTLEVGNVRIRAAALVVATGGKIVGDTSRMSTTTLETFRGGIHDGAILIMGRVEQNNDLSGGTVLIASEGEIWISGGGQVEARGNGVDADGGYVEIIARDLLEVDGTAISIDVSGGGRDATGGSVYLESLRSDVIVRQKVDAHGQEGGGGEMEMLAYAGSVTTIGTLDLHASGYGDGGELSIAAHLLIRCEGLVDADAGSGTLAYGGGTGGSITLECDREVEVLDRLHAQGGIDSDGGEIEVSCRDFSFTGGSIMLQSTGYGGSGGTLSVDARRDLTLSGLIEASGDNFGWGGTVELAAEGNLLFDGDIRARGGIGGDVTLGAGGSAVVSGDADANGKGTDGAGGTLEIEAGGELDLSGAILEVDGASATGSGGELSIRAGPVLTADASTRLRARGNASNGGDAGNLSIEGCRISFPSGSQLSAQGNSGGTLSIRANDVLTLGGSVRADAGTLSLTTRLDAPWSPVTTGASFVPAPVIVHDRMLSPCLASDTTSLSGSSVVHAGQSFTLTLHSVPNRKLVVALDFLPNYQPIGALGWQALSPGTAYFAADFGHFGPAKPNSRTDASGDWSWTSPALPVGFLGRTLYAEAFVLDPLARNGIFHQTPLWSEPVLP